MGLKRCVTGYGPEIVDQQVQFRCYGAGLAMETSGTERILPISSLGVEDGSGEGLTGDIRHRDCGRDGPT